MKAFRHVADASVTLAKWTAIAAAAVMAVMIFLQVIYRYVLADSLSYSEELARYMFVWSVALGSALALRNRAHIGVELVVERLPPRLARSASLLAGALNLLFFGLLIRYGVEMVAATMDQESAALSLPMGYVYLAVPVSGVVLFLCETANLVDDHFGGASAASGEV